MESFTQSVDKKVVLYFIDISTKKKTILSHLDETETGGSAYKKSSFCPFMSPFRSSRSIICVLFLLFDKRTAKDVADAQLPVGSVTMA